jgi:stage V sporulation protein D (sporulation-specific penicillin-binding protein)
MLSAAGLNCIIEGDSSSVVQSQDVEAGASVQKGTIVTVTCAAQ